MIMAISKPMRITIAGFGGQGVMMLGQMLAYSGNEENLNSLWFPSYGPETRGGTANCSVILSPVEIKSPVFAKADIVIAMNKPSMQKYCSQVVSGGTLLYNTSLIDNAAPEDSVRMIGIPVNDIAQQLGNPKVANMVMLGAFLETTQIFSEEVIEKILKKFLGEAKSHLLPINIEAIRAGRNFITKFGEGHAQKA
jgi:2-oxoglutarate ferredoxin oxidoreductase subunit gamma